MDIVEEIGIASDFEVTLCYVRASKYYYIARGDLFQKTLNIIIATCKEELLGRELPLPELNV